MDAHSDHRQSGGTAALLRERNSIANSEREIDSVLGQAFSISSTLANQRRTFGEPAFSLHYTAPPALVFICVYSTSLLGFPHAARLLQAADVSVRGGW